MLDLVGLTGVAAKRAGGFSLGMSQRLGITAALLGDPHVLLPDEPVNGLDPEGVLWIRNLMKHLAGQAAGLTALVVGSWNRPGSGNGQVQIIEDPVAFILGAGLGIGQLTICVLGVLLITTEYSTGVIKASLLAVPRRIPCSRPRSRSSRPC